MLFLKRSTFLTEGTSLPVNLILKSPPSHLTPQINHLLENGSMAISNVDGGDRMGPPEQAASGTIDLK